MSNQFTIYKCKHCNNHFIKEDWGDELEESLWDHIQMDHEDVFEELQNLETPDMIESAYDVNYELA